MANAKESVSFDDIIQADRQRKKNEALAEEIFGRGRKSATGNNVRKPPAPSLASRVGIAKASQRSNSNTPRSKGNVEGPWGHDLHETDTKAKNTRQAKENPMARNFKKDLLFNAATGRNGVDSEITIRGKAGPYVVIGSNFAPGTTAADIESALLPVGGDMQSCRIVTASPTVMAEMVFAEKQNAEAVIETFNNKKADGRVLHIYLKQGPPAPAAASTTMDQSTEQQPIKTEAPRGDEQVPSYDSRREQADRSRRRAEPEYQDGSFGFEAKDNQMDVDMEAPTPLGAPPQPAPPLEPRRDDRGYGRRNDRYEPPRSYGRGRYDDRDRGYGRPRDDRRLYSDNLYPRQGGGYR